jgi:hypothetical protein
MTPTMVWMLPRVLTMDLAILNRSGPLVGVTFQRFGPLDSLFKHRHVDCLEPLISRVSVN